MSKIDSKRINCGDCKYFKQTGFEDFYNTGVCKHPSPKLELGGAMTDWYGGRPLAEWFSCYQAKRKRKRKAA